jgi:rhodanese-related sulfurtransferase
MKTFSVIIIYTLIFCGPITGQVPDSVKFKSLPPNDFHLTYLKEDKAILIDVREFFEFRKTRLKNAVNIPSSGKTGTAADTIDKQSALFFYCTTGFRSKRVARDFYDKGFSRLYSLEGGIVAWKKEGFPVDKKRRRAHDTGLTTQGRKK